MADKKFETCFIITPIGGDMSEIRRQADGVIKSVLRPLLIDEYFFKEVSVAHEISKSGSINNQVMTGILDADLVIANLTGLNPNVMYELAVRHATQKPIIHICEKSTTVLPFDIADQRTLFYENDMLGVEELTVSLRKTLDSLTPDSNCSDNPIYNARKQMSIYKELEKEGDVGDINKFIIDKLNMIEHKMLRENNNLDSYLRDVHNEKRILDISIRFPEEEFSNSVTGIIRNTLKVKYDINCRTRIGRKFNEEMNVLIYDIPVLSKKFVNSIIEVLNEELPDSYEIYDYRIRV